MKRKELKKAMKLKEQIEFVQEEIDKIKWIEGTNELHKIVFKIALSDLKADLRHLKKQLKKL